MSERERIDLLKWLYERRNWNATSLVAEGVPLSMESLRALAAEPVAEPDEAAVAFDAEWERLEKELYFDICGALGWGYDPNTDARLALPRATRELLDRLPVTPFVPPAPARDVRDVLTSMVTHWWADAPDVIQIGHVAKLIDQLAALFAGKERGA